MIEDLIKEGCLVRVAWQDPRMGWRPAELRAVMGKVGTVLNISASGHHAEILFTSPECRRSLLIFELEMV